MHQAQPRLCSLVPALAAAKAATRSSQADVGPYSPPHTYGLQHTAAPFAVLQGLPEPMHAADALRAISANSSSSSASRRADACTMLDGAREDMGNLQRSKEGASWTVIPRQLARHTRGDATLVDARGSSASCTAHQACVHGAHRSASACALPCCIRAIFCAARRPRHCQWARKISTK